MHSPNCCAALVVVCIMAVGVVVVACISLWVFVYCWFFYSWSSHMGCLFFCVCQGGGGEGIPIYYNDDYDVVDYCE